PGRCSSTLRTCFTSRRRPARSTTPSPYTTLFRSHNGILTGGGVAIGNFIGERAGIEAFVVATTMLAARIASTRRAAPGQTRHLFSSALIFVEGLFLRLAGQRSCVYRCRQTASSQQPDRTQ